METPLGRNPATALVKSLPHPQLQERSTLAQEHIDAFQVVAVTADYKHEAPQPCDTMARDPHNETTPQPTN